MRTQAPLLTPSETDANDRRTKTRFQIRRELRYMVLDKGKTRHSGAGSTMDIGSGGVAFRADQPLETGMSIELLINWPALLDSVCPMRLCVVGRILRAQDLFAVCTVDRHQFQTRCMSENPALVESGSALQRRLIGANSGSSAAGA